MSKTLADRMIDDGGRGPVRSPGRRLQTGKYTYRPTEILGKRHVFSLSRPLTVTVKEVEGDVLVSCKELEMQGIAGATHALALKVFAECFEESYEVYVKHNRRTKHGYDGDRIRSLFLDVIRKVRTL